MKFRIILVVVNVIQFIETISYQDLIVDEWNFFKMKYGIKYGDTLQENYRFNIFERNFKNIWKHNERFIVGLETFEMSLNQFSDMSRSEISRTLNGLSIKKSSYKSGRRAFSFITPSNINVPAYLNWTDLGAVTPVKDQEFCGSCWAFATTGALEGQIFRSTKKLISLSEQNLIDCSWENGNNGCIGGKMIYAYEYIQQNDGIDTESGYPYDGEDWWCRYKLSEKGATDKGYVELPSGNETKLMEVVATIGPVSVGIDASHSSFHFYSDGIYFEKKCNQNGWANHAVLVVGYGKDEATGSDYWLVKNSWGITWGKNGYIKMARNKHNNCFIASCASYPLV